jgi:hypothetical protein
MFESIFSKISENYPGCSVFIPDPGGLIFTIPDPGVKKAPDPGSATLDSSMFNSVIPPNLELQFPLSLLRLEGQTVHCTS